MIKDSMLYDDTNLIEERNKPISKMKLDKLSEEEKNIYFYKIIDSIDILIDNKKCRNYLNNVNQALVILHFLDLAEYICNLKIIPHSDNNRTNKTNAVVKAKSDLFNALLRAKDVRAFDVLAMLDKILDDYQAPSRINYINEILSDLDEELKNVGVNNDFRLRLKTIVKNFYQITINFN